MKKVLHLLTGGNPGGIETLCREISRTALFENGFVFMTFGGKIYEQMKSAGAIVYPLFELGNTLCIKKMDELIRISKLYDVLIIHHEDPFLCLYYCNTLKKVGIPGIRYVHSCYDDYWLKYKNPFKNHIFHFIMQRTLDLSKRVVFVSEAGRKSCNNQYHVDKHKQKVIYNGISNELLLMGKKNSLNIDYYSNNIIEILYIGRLSYIKGIDKLIIAVSNILRNKKIHLTIVGDGDDRFKLMQMVEDLSIREHVSFEGFQTNLERYLSRTVYFVYPSDCKEVFGISIVEAMSYGIPCIANRVGGIPEIIQDGFNGFLTEDVTSESLENTLNKALDINLDVYIELSENAKITAGNFTINKCQKGILEVINQIE